MDKYTCSYHVMDATLKKHGLIANRVCCINQKHGCRYDNASDNPCKLVRSDSGYVVTYCGANVAGYRLSDPSSVDDAFTLVDALDNALWLIRRAGYLAVPA